MRHASDMKWWHLELALDETLKLQYLLDGAKVKELTKLNNKKVLQDDTQKSTPKSAKLRDVLPPACQLG